VARFLADENFPQPAVEELRRLGHDVLTVRDAGQSGQAWPDREVLLFAVREGRAVVTLNRRDFLQLHREVPAHAGLVLCTADLDFAGQASRIHAAVSALPDLHGQVLRVNRPLR
jgi:predicted nuclease of predicted toxin-antitoxin system